MTTETTGKCPKCGSTTNTRFGQDWFSFDICPNCGFGYGIDSLHEALVAEEVFQATLEAVRPLLALESLSGLKRLLDKESQETLAFSYENDKDEMFEISINSFFQKMTVSGKLFIFSDQEISSVSIKINYLNDSFAYMMGKTGPEYYFNGLKINLESKYNKLQEFPLTENFMPVIFAVALSKVLEKIQNEIYDLNYIDQHMYRAWIREIYILNETSEEKKSVSNFLTEKKNKVFRFMMPCGVPEEASEYKMKGDLFQIDYSE